MGTNMDIFDDKESCEIVTVADGKEFREFLNSTPHGLTFVPEKYRELDGLVIKADVGAFSKWIKQNKPEINIEVRKADKKLELRSSDFWLPLVFLANDIALPVYLNLVANYAYDRMRGALRGEEARVHLEVIYEDKQKAIIKKFKFDGDVNGLQKAIKKFNLNKFMD